ncbi:MAG: hypothetical protein AABY22_17750 [Nanoarchaeota archaeon]
MNINRDKLYNLYMDKINDITGNCEDKSIFGPKEIVNIIADLIENNKIIDYSDEEYEYRTRE